MRLRGQIKVKVGFYAADSRTKYSRQIHVHSCILPTLLSRKLLFWNDLKQILQEAERTEVKNQTENGGDANVGRNAAPDIAWEDEGGVRRF